MAKKMHDSEYYNFHKNTNHESNPHYFLGEELLVPRANNCDTQRLNMFSNHINQFVHLKNPEFPRVFTNFEDQIGEYSIAYKKAPETFEVLKKIVKNKYNYILIVKYTKTGVYDVLHYEAGRNITEDYGLKLNDCIEDVDVGDTVHKGEYLYKSDNYDDDGNFSYGVNLNAVYQSFQGMTYEDAIVISESAAKKLTSYKVEKTGFTINGNDVLLNLYGGPDEYKSFPKVGDHVDSKILVGIRRRNKFSVLYDFQNSKMREVDPVTDDVIYTGGGDIVDINIYSNISLNDLKKRNDEFNREIVVQLEDQFRFWREVATALEEIIPCRSMTEKEIADERSEFGHSVKHPLEREKNPNQYTDELAYYWKLSHENIDEKIQWRADGKSFDNFRIEFSILKENPLTPGCKLSGRYGNKGVISCILPDENFPTNSDGKRVDVFLNPLGVIGRLNPSQLQEQHLNFMADHVLEIMKQSETYEEKERVLFEFLEAITPKEESIQYDKRTGKALTDRFGRTKKTVVPIKNSQWEFYYREYQNMNRAQKEAFIDETIENGIFIHQAPFFGNTRTDDFLKILKIHPEWCTEYKFDGIEKPMVMGAVYFIRLKHEPSNKSSMRSATNLNVKNIPAKSALKKEKKILYSSTPIRLGEMEVTNLMIAKRGDVVEKLLKTYSTNEEAREATIEQLLLPGTDNEGNTINPLNMDLRVDLTQRSINRDVLEKYLNVLELSLTDNLENS